MQVVPPRRQLRHWRTGETWDWFDARSASVQRYGTPHILLHRSDLHGILVEAVRKRKPDAIKLGMRCAAVTQTADAATAQFANGERARRSRHDRRRRHSLQVRACLFGASKPQFTGCVAWRGLVPMDRLPPHLRAAAQANWLGPHGHVLHYPVRRGELMNFISIVERDDWQVESWMTRAARTNSPTIFAAGTPTCTTFIDKIATPYKWALMVRGPMQRWTERPNHAARRRLPSDLAVSRPGRGDGDRGRLHGRRVLGANISPIRDARSPL